ncbi:MAG: permease [Betaproteobacteria bacterium]|nr:permease [Betaproteobacteria bacterium]
MTDALSDRALRGLAITAVLLSLVGSLTGCAGGAPVSATVSGSAGGDELRPAAPLEYYQMLQRMTGAQLARERQMLAALPGTPLNNLRMAMLLGHPRAQQDLPKALALLDGVLKSSDPAAVALQPLARLLADACSERLRLDTQLDKQGQQLKESQRRVVELQEKIDSLAEIERSLPQRPRQTRPAAGAAER